MQSFVGVILTLLYHGLPIGNERQPVQLLEHRVVILPAPPQATELCH